MSSGPGRLGFFVFLLLVGASAVLMFTGASIVAVVAPMALIAVGGYIWG